VYAPAFDAAASDAVFAASSAAFVAASIVFVRGWLLGIVGYVGVGCARGCVSS